MLHFHVSESRCSSLILMICQIRINLPFTRAKSTSRQQGPKQLGLLSFSMLLCYKQGGQTLYSTSKSLDESMSFSKLTCPMCLLFKPSLSRPGPHGSHPSVLGTGESGRLEWPLGGKCVRGPQKQMILLEYGKILFL